MSLYISFIYKLYQNQINLCDGKKGETAFLKTLHTFLSAEERVQSSSKHVEAADLWKIIPHLAFIQQFED